MHFAKKALLATAFSVVCGSAMASSIPQATINVYDGMSSVTVNTSSQLGLDKDPIFYELNVTDTNGARAYFTLIDTDPDNQSVTGEVTYTLYEDNNGALGLIDLGTQLIQKSILDLNQAGAEGYFQYFFASAGQFVLAMSTNLTNASSTSTISAVPLPGAALLFGTALAGLGFARRRQQQQAAVAA